MSRRAAFLVLVLLAVSFAVLGGRWQSGFLSDLWSQLFWLTLGTLATTFVLDAILQRSDSERRRSKDAFAFRSFSANLLNLLGAIVGLQPKDESLFEAVLAGGKQFAAVAKHIASIINQSSIDEPAIYLKYRLDIASGLRDLSRNYIRLFSTNSKEMLVQYRELNELASQWEYKDELSEAFREHTASLPAGNPVRLAREVSTHDQLSSTRYLVISTATYLANLAVKTAAGKGFYD